MSNFILFRKSLAIKHLGRAARPKSLTIKGLGSICFRLYSRLDRLKKLFGGQPIFRLAIKRDD